MKNNINKKIMNIQSKKTFLSKYKNDCSSVKKKILNAKRII